EDVKSCGSFLDGGFGEARNLEEAARGCRIASGVERRRRFGLVGSDGRVGVERGAGADVNFNVMKSALGFNNAVPAERRTRFGKRCGPAWQFAAVSARFHGGQGVGMEDGAQNDVKNHGG